MNTRNHVHDTCSTCLFNCFWLLDFTHSNKHTSRRKLFLLYWHLSSYRTQKPFNKQWWSLQPSTQGFKTQYSHKHIQLGQLLQKVFLSAVGGVYCSLLFFFLRGGVQRLSVHSGWSLQWSCRLSWWCCEASEWTRQWWRRWGWTPLWPRKTAKRLWQYELRQLLSCTTLNSKILPNYTSLP